MQQENVFEIGGIDVEAARDDHVLLAVGDLQEALLVENADIAGTEIGDAVGVVPEQRLRCGIVVVVAVHDLADASDDLAPGAERQLLAVVVDDLDVLRGIGLPDRVQLVGPFMSAQDREGRAFRHAVDFDQAARPGLDERALPLRRQMGTGTPLHRGCKAAHRGHRLGIVHQAADLDGHEVDIARRCVFAGADEFRRRELPEETHAAAGIERVDQRAHRPVAVKRRGGKGNYALREGERSELHRRVRAHGVVDHDAFRPAGRTRAVDDVELVSERDVDRRTIGRRRFEKRVQLLPARRFEIRGDPPEWERHGVPGQQCAAGLRGEEYRRAGIREHACDGIGADQGRDRYGGRTGLENAQDDGRGPRAGVGDKRDAPAFRNACRDQRIGDAIGAQIEFAPADRLAHVVQRRISGTGAAVEIEPVDERFAGQGHHALPRMIALVGAGPGPPVTRQTDAPATWHVEVPRIWRTPSTT